MKKTTMLLLLFGASSLYAGFDFEIGPSYRLDWQKTTGKIINAVIAVPENLDQYKHVSIWEIAGRMQTDHCTQFYVGALGKYGWVASGVGNTNQTTLFNGAVQNFALNHNELWGHTYDLQLYGGYRLNFLRRRFSFIPCGGYEYHRKKFTLTKGDLEVNEIESFAEILSNFKHVDQLRGPFAGFDLEWVLNKCFFFSGGFHWNWYRYTSLGEMIFSTNQVDTNLLQITAFKAAEKTYITGPSFFLGMNYKLTKKLFISLQTSYYITYFLHGKEINTFLLDSFNGGTLQSQNYVQTDLKVYHLNWSSWSGQLLLGYHF